MPLHSYHHPRTLGFLFGTFLLPALVIILFFMLSLSLSQEAGAADVEEVIFPSLDNLPVVADLYRPDDTGISSHAKAHNKNQSLNTDRHTDQNVKPETVIIALHREGSSRGEYKHIAPRLAEHGYTVLAVDLRAGGIFAGIENKTARNARNQRLFADYTQTYPDMMAAILYARRQLGAQKTILWGSSRTASLALLFANSEAVQNPVQPQEGAGEQSDVKGNAGGKRPMRAVSGVIAFSPAEHYNFNPAIYLNIDRIDVPVFITSSRDEKKKWLQIFHALTTKDKKGYVPARSGASGSSALLSRAGEEYWQALFRFLEQYFPAANAESRQGGKKPPESSHDFFTRQDMGEASQAPGKKGRSLNEQMDASNTDDRSQPTQNQKSRFNFYAE